MQGMSFGPADLAASRRMKTTRVGGGHPGYRRRSRDPDPTRPPTRRARRPPSRTRGTTRSRAWSTPARAPGILPFYGPFGDIKDVDGCEAQFRAAFLLGCVGAWSLHPVQIDIAKKVFSPDPDEVAFAKKVIEAIPDGRGVHMIDGKMQDDATWKQCQVMVDLAEMLAAKDPELAEAYGFAPAAASSAAPADPRRPHIGSETSPTPPPRSWTIVVMPDRAVPRGKPCRVTDPRRRRVRSRGSSPPRCCVLPAPPALALSPQTLTDPVGDNCRDYGAGSGASADRTSRRSSSRRPGDGNLHVDITYVSLPPSPGPELPAQIPEFAELGIYPIAATTPDLYGAPGAFRVAQTSPGAVDAPVDVRRSPSWAP